MASSAPLTWAPSDHSADDQEGPCEEEKDAAFLFILEGRNASHLGLELIDNPYSPGTHESDCWLKGWLNGPQIAQSESQIGPRPL